MALPVGTGNATHVLENRSPTSACPDPMQTEQDQAALRSPFDDLAPTDADHVDIYFGPQQPANATGRWIQTVPGRGWFCCFRIYGPHNRH